MQWDRLDRQEGAADRGDHVSLWGKSRTWAALGVVLLLLYNAMGLTRMSNDFEARIKASDALHTRQLAWLAARVDVLERNAHVTAAHAAPAAQRAREEQRPPPPPAPPLRREERGSHAAAGKAGPPPPLPPPPPSPAPTPSPTPMPTLSPPAPPDSDAVVEKKAVLREVRALLRAPFCRARAGVGLPLLPSCRSLPRRGARIAKARHRPIPVHRPFPCSQVALSLLALAGALGLCVFVGFAFYLSRAKPDEFKPNKPGPKPKPKPAAEQSAPALLDGAGPKSDAAEHRGGEYSA